MRHLTPEKYYVFLQIPSVSKENIESNSKGINLAFKTNS